MSEPCGGIVLDGPPVGSNEIVLDGPPVGANEIRVESLACPTCHGAGYEDLTPRGGSIVAVRIVSCRACGTGVELTGDALTAALLDIDIKNHPAVFEAGRRAGLAAALPVDPAADEAFAAFAATLVRPLASVKGLCADLCPAPSAQEMDEALGRTRVVEIATLRDANATLEAGWQQQAARIGQMESDADDLRDLLKEALPEIDRSGAGCRVVPWAFRGHRAPCPVGEDPWSMTCLCEKAPPRPACDCVACRIEAIEGSA